MNYLTKDYTSEKALEKATNKALRDIGCLVYKFTSPAKRGVPDDIVFLQNGRAVLIEYKNPNGKGKLSPLQEIEIERLSKQNVMIFVVSNTTSANATLSLIDQLNSKNNLNNVEI